MESSLRDFLMYMKDVKNASQNTLLSYKNDIAKLFRHLNKQNITDVEKINETSLNSYVLSMERNGMSPATVSRNIASIKAFTFYLIKKGRLHQDPTERMKSPKVEKKPPSTLTLEEVNRLLEMPNTDTIKGIRDKAMLELLYATGIRVSELISLKIENINLKSRYIVCCSSKNERIIPFGSMAAGAMENYFQHARDKFLKEKESDICFMNVSGEPMSRQGFWKIIKAYGKSAGITHEITPQILRHSFALHMIENGADIASIQELLGHTDAAATQVYLGNRSKKIRDVYMGAHPRA
ncbi:tyrosine recombinase [Anaerocolumna sp.]|uniref:tyrosine recombinase n=1 Tax=Anaerocolumna sp. TaxID=2041569 RepID=UPI0028ABE6A4|nr:tyrosine recombinase [Anaerocolumna sp.]